MNRRYAVFAVIYAVFLLIDIQAVEVSRANPYSFAGEVPPDSETFPPTIAISSPKNNTAYATNRLPLVFNVTAPQSKTAASTIVQIVTYQADWMDKTVDVFMGGQEQVSLSLQFSNIPEGTHRIIIQAAGSGVYMEGLSYKEFRISSSTELRFSIDTIPPTITIKETLNTTSEQEIPLDFLVNETTAKVSYVLDNSQNITIGGNTTLHDLPVGEHNLTLYAWDLAGNIGASQTAFFTVQMPEAVLSELFPIVTVAAVSLVGTAVVGTSLLVYFKKHKPNTGS
jgi:hypothetical protein